MNTYEKSFTRSHKTAEIDTNTIPHSSHLNLCHSGFGQVQYIAFFCSSVKIFLKDLTLKVRGRASLLKKLQMEGELPLAQA